MANKRNNPNPTVAPTRKRIVRRKGPLSGYQYFITITKCPPGMVSTEQMSYKATEWAKLSKAEQVQYKIKSEEVFGQKIPIYSQNMNNDWLI